MKKVFITGATGFLGKHAVKEFADNNYAVIAFGRNETVGKCLESKNVKFIKGDFTRYEEVLNASTGVDLMVHAGALSTVWGKWEDFYLCNVEGTVNVAKACIENGIEKMVYVSSPSIYTRDSDCLNIHEDDFDSSNKLNFYIKSKIMSEQALCDVAGEQLYYNIIRPRGLVGSGDTSIIPRIIRLNSNKGVPLLNAGRNIVDMTSVENVAYALRLCLEAEGNNGSVYNITNGEANEFKVLLEQLFREIGVVPKYINLSYKLIYTIACILEGVYKLFGIYKKEPVLTKYIVCTLGHSQTLDISRAEKELGYQRRVSLEESMGCYANIK